MFHIDAEKTQKPAKRYSNGSIKNETNINMNDNVNVTNGTQQKKNKTSHVYKQEQTIPLTTTRIKEEPNIMTNNILSNEMLSIGNTITNTTSTTEPKKKPTAK